ncbi:sodium:solute symporter family transporter [Sutcliffiella cohnii]|uniref:sodium:solute symporter family transporter n=1 Tax=Sutcliffiella cohnii TaxID=33932 RepID=UPI002E1DA175|nr:hypothetical protein [Sutcliffiella cohnii]
MSTAPALLYAIVGVGIFAAINSTADAHLHASGAMTGHDLYRVLTGSTTINPWIGRIAQLFVVVTGLIMVNQSQSTLVYLGALAGGLGMQTIPALMGAVFWKTFNKYGVFYGMIVGVLVTILTEFVWKHPFGVHSGLWGLLANFAVAYLLSAITKEVISDDSYEKFHCVLEREYGDIEETPSDIKMPV